MNTNRFNIRKALTYALFTALVGSTSLVTLAGGGSGTTRNNSASTAQVRYISGKEGESYFNVVYNNASGSRFIVVVLDAEGTELFQSAYSDKQFNKTFKLADASEFTKLTFVIRNFGDNSVQRFEVKANSRLVEDVEVKEIN